jgi:phosphoribosyl 1,2-cyclic phosphate phosphodiesterase
MTIRLLGTGAAEGIPAFYSNSEVSRYAREHGGKDVRTRSGALLDCCIKIDLPPDTMLHMHRDKLDAQEWSALIFTHSHDDHFAPAELQYCLYPFNEMDFLDFTIFGNDAIVPRLQEMYPAWPLDIIQTRSFQCFRHEEYLITPVHANHKLDEDAHNLIFQKDGKTLLYATDTGTWFEETWLFLRDFSIDLLVLECTEGFHCTDYHGHLDITGCIDTVQRLRAQGSLLEQSMVVTTHHSHNGGATHQQLERALNPFQIQVGYDGMEVTTP